MSQNTIKIAQLIKEVIEEVGDLQNIQPLPYDLEKGTFTVPYKGKEYRGKVLFTFFNKQGLEMIKFPPVVDLAKFTTGYSIGYSIEGIGSQYIRGDAKLLFTVLKTVSILISEFITNHPESIYLIFAENKTGIGMEDPQKLLLYKQILGKNLPQGFRIGEMGIEGIVQGLFICKIK